MATLKIIQAEHGDCFLLTFDKNGNNKNMLIDGGPRGTYRRHLKDILLNVNSKNEILDFVVLSHVDSDHISGLLDLLFELEEQRVNGEQEVVAIDQIWANTFQNTIGANNDIVNRFQAVMSTVNNMESVMSNSAIEVLGINQGNKLRIQALKLDIDLNKGFDDELISIDTATDTLEEGELKITMLGPSKENLEELRLEWMKWLENNENAIMSGDFDVMANADKSKPNLSSIMFLAEVNGTTILFTGDGRSDHLYDALESQNLLDSEGKIHLDFFKVPHHASNRNTTKTFLKKVTADKYIISANGRHHNPDLATLIWLVESAKQRNANIELIITNETSATRKLLEEYPKQEYGYKITYLEEDESFALIEI